MLLLPLVGCGTDIIHDAPCVRPTVAPTLVAGGSGMPQAFLEVDLGELATGRDPVVLTSVHLRTGPQGAPSEVRAVRLAASGDVLWPSPEDVDLRALADRGRLSLALDLAAPPARAGEATADVCVRKFTPRGML